MKKIDLNDENLFRQIIKTIFILYLILLVWAVYFKFGDAEDVKAFYVNFSSKYTLAYRFYRCIIPFTKIVVSSGEVSILPAIDIKDALNVFVFIPFGFFAHYLKGEDKKKTLLYALGATVAIEAVQFFTLIGAFATKDIVTNFLGAAIGMLLFYAYKKIPFSRIHNICAIVLLCLASVMTVVAVCTVIMNIDGYLFVLLRK